MSTIFERLQFPSFLSANSIPLSEATQKTMNTVPRLLSDWQYNDLANADTGGYYENKLVPYINNLISINNQISGNTSYNPDLTSIYNATQTLAEALPLFKAHTDRLSGVTAVTSATVNLPHYDSAIGLGKMLTQLVYQSDGVANNAVMIGSLGSLFQGDILDGYYKNLQPYPALIKLNEWVETTTNPETSETTTVYRSNLTPSQITTIVFDINTAKERMNTCISSDVTFFQNARAVSNDFHAVRAFSNTGQTENDLLNNYVGSDKLLSRIN